MSLTRGNSPPHPGKLTLTQAVRVGTHGKFPVTPEGGGGRDNHLNHMEVPLFANDPWHGKQGMTGEGVRHVY